MIDINKAENEIDEIQDKLRNYLQTNIEGRNNNDKSLRISRRKQELAQEEQEFHSPMFNKLSKTPTRPSQSTQNSPY